jgi:hypothetical protein
MNVVPRRFSLMTFEGRQRTSDTGLSADAVRSLLPHLLLILKKTVQHIQCLAIVFVDDARCVTLIVRCRHDCQHGGRHALNEHQGSPLCAPLELRQKLFHPSDVVVAVDLKCGTSIGHVVL